MRLSHIVAMAKNRAIGLDGRLPWHLPEDFKIFKRVTMQHVLIMGRKTFASIGRPLPGRISVVVTRQNAWPAPPGVLVCRSVDAAIEQAAAESERLGWGEELMVIGGGELYQQTLPMTSTVYLTLVDQHVEGDTFYPELPVTFSLAEATPHLGSPSFTWQIHRRHL